MIEKYRHAIIYNNKSRNVKVLVSKIEFVILNLNIYMNKDEENYWL